MTKVTIPGDVGDIKKEIEKLANRTTSYVECKMNIGDALKSYCKELRSAFASTCIPTDEKGYWNINVVFINKDGDEDETQFDIKPSNFDYVQGKCPKLIELWKGFCRENDFKQNSVIRVYMANIE